MQGVHSHIYVQEAGLQVPPIELGLLWPLESLGSSQFQKMRCNKPRG